ncbi:MAG: CoA pyrophosphatase [Candidatus Marinimicrobia bacterium]|jgi:8-oxo-dGTP pyrophosphatase MutT (NUDIX family)|nr:CoA pyrophosphatase [Candidatus Neomarinimicrobiota bacterium]
MNPLFIENLSKNLNKVLPGKNAQEKMMVKPRRFRSKENREKGIPASVLLLLYPFNEDWFFFLTKRSKNVEHHKGQISLPGGMVEKNESLIDAAIRETHEEIGINKSKMNIIGRLTSFYVPVSNFEIFPYIGWTDTKPKTMIHDKEVERIFSVSINDLILEKNCKLKEDIFSNQPVTVPYFELGGEMVWGATSMILSEFKHIIKDRI